MAVQVLSNEPRLNDDEGAMLVIFESQWRGECSADNSATAQNESIATLQRFWHCSRPMAILPMPSTTASPQAKKKLIYSKIQSILIKCSWSKNQTKTLQLSIKKTENEELILGKVQPSDCVNG